MIIHIINRQNIRRPDVKKIKAALDFFMNKAASGIGSAALADVVTLLLTDDAGIRPLKRQFFDLDCITDVISFSSRPQPDGGKRRTADLAVNVERACLEGKKRRGVEHEFALYLAHGCDHLAGHDDRTAGERRKMRRRELRWLNEAAELNLLRGLFGSTR